MINVAICDDDNLQLDLTSAALNEFTEANPHITIKTSVFSSPHDLIEAAEIKGGFDIYILDVVMPEMSGIELGKALRKNSDKGLIIYLSTERDFALDSYITDAFYYFLKPIERQSFFNVISKAFRMIGEQNSKSLTVKTDSGVLRLLFKEIAYADLNNRCIHFHLTDGSMLTTPSLRMTFAEAISPLLKDNRFVLCGASFAINLEEIKNIDGVNVVTRSSGSFSPPKKLVPSLRTNWLDYLLEG